MTKPTRTDLADRVQALRLAKGLTQADLAAQIGLTERAVRYIENGKTMLPSLATLDALAAVLEVEPDSLVVHPARGKPRKPVTDLGERLRALRQQRGLSQDALAALIGKARSSIRNLEDGTVERPHQRLVDAIADALGVAPNDLTTDVFDPANPKQPRLVEPPEPPAQVAPVQVAPVQVAPIPPAHPALTALAAAVRAYDPLAEVAIDGEGPALACWLSNGQLCYFRDRHGWAHYLRSQGIEAPDDLPDLINPQRQTPSAAQRDGLLAVMKG